MTSQGGALPRSLENSCILTGRVLRTRAGMGQVWWEREGAASLFESASWEEDWGHQPLCCCLGLQRDGQNLGFRGTGSCGWEEGLGGL